MFLIRSAFWLTLIVLLVPFKGEVGPNGGPAVGAAEAFGVASAAIHDIGGFCARNAAACETGGRLVSGIALKVQAGARWVYEAIEAKFEGDPEAEAPAPTAAGTLTADDRAAEWRGPDAGA